MKNFVSLLLRELNVNEIIIDEGFIFVDFNFYLGLIKMEEMREVFVKRLAVCEKFDRESINSEVIEPLFD